MANPSSGRLTSDTRVGSIRIWQPALITQPFTSASRTQMKAFVRGWRTQRAARCGLRGSSSTPSKPGMAYPVNITARAERDLAYLYDEVNAGDSDAALRWYL